MPSPHRETDGQGPSVNWPVNDSSTGEGHRNSRRTWAGEYAVDELAQFDVLKQYPGLTDALLSLVERSRVHARALKGLCMADGSVTTREFARFGNTTRGTARVYLMRLREYGVLETTRDREAHHSFASDDIGILVRFILETACSEWAASFDPTRGIDRDYFGGPGRLTPSAVRVIDSETRLERDITRYGLRGPPNPPSS